MPKIDVNKVAEILKKNHIDPAVLRRVVAEMNLAAQPDPGDGDQPPPVKKQYLILLSDPEGRMPKGDFTGWVLQIPESESPASSQERLLKGTFDYNASKRGALSPAKTVGDALENVPARFFRDVELWVKTKTPVVVLRTDNEIPKACHSRPNLDGSRPRALMAAATALRSTRAPGRTPFAANQPCRISSAYCSWSPCEETVRSS